MSPSDQNESGPASAQALSDNLKDAVKSWVPKVRKALDDEFGAQLERLGLLRNGKHVALDKMSLPVSSVSVRHRVEALVAHESLSEGTPERGYDNVIRELTYTLLNRIVGLKAMEARKLLYLTPPGDANAAPEETEVITPVPGQVRSRYLRDFRAASGSRYKYEDDAEEALLRDGLTSAFRQVTSEIRVLFDPDHEYLIAAAATAAQNPKNQSMLDWAIRVQPQIPFILDSMGVKWDHIHPVMGWINRIVYCGQSESISLEMDFRKEVETVKEMVEVFTLHQKLATLSDSEEQLNIRDEIRAYLLTLLGGGDANPETFKQIRSRIETASR